MVQLMLCIRKGTEWIFGAAQQFLLREMLHDVVTAFWDCLMFSFAAACR